MRNLLPGPFGRYSSAAIALAIIAGLSACSEPVVDPATSLKDGPTVEKAKYSPSPRLAQPKPVRVSAPVRPATQPATEHPAKTAMPTATIADCREKAECAARLSAMIADPNQSWMAKEPTALEFSTGTRLFAFRALKAKLDCRKLAAATKELDWAIATFSKSVPGLEDSVAALVRDESKAVHQDIVAETKSRC